MCMWGGGGACAGAWGLVLKGLADSPLGSSLQVVGGQFRITGSECVTSCGQTGYPITVSSTAPTAGSCTVRYAMDPGLVCFNTPLSPGRVGCAWAATCTWNQPATVTLRAPGAGGVPVVLATAYVLVSGQQRCRGGGTGRGVRWDGREPGPCTCAEGRCMPGRC